MNRQQRDKIIAESDAPAAELAEQFGVSRSTVYRVKQRAALAQNVSEPESEPFAARRANRKLLFDAVGRSGLTRYGGRVEEEYQRELREDGGVKLFAQMANHPVAAAVLFSIQMAQRAVSWYVEPAGEEKVDEDAAEFLEQCMDDMSQTWDDVIAQVFSMLKYGFQLCELIYKKRQGQEMRGDAAKSRFTDGKIGWRRWQFISPKSLDIADRWDFDDYGRVQGFTQVAVPDYKPVYIPMEKALLFRTSLEWDNPEGLSILRPQYSSWYYAENLAEVEAIAAERMGAGLPVVYLGNDVSKDVDDVNSMWSLAKDITREVRIDEQMGVVIPYPKMGGGAPEGTGMLFELLSAPSQGVDFNAIIDRHEKRMAMTVLAQFIFLGMLQVGTQALNSSATDTFQMSIGAWSDSVAAVINRFAVPRLFKLNQFSNEVMTNLPQVAHSDIGVPDLPALAQFINQLVGVQVLTPDGQLEAHLREEAGLPEQEEPEIEITEAPPETPEDEGEEEGPEIQITDEEPGMEAAEAFGGPGSGHHGHKGVPGSRGGSSPGGGGLRLGGMSDSEVQRELIDARDDKAAFEVGEEMAKRMPFAQKTLARSASEVPDLESWEFPSARNLGSGRLSVFKNQMGGYEVGFIKKWEMDSQFYNGSLGRIQAVKPVFPGDKFTDEPFALKTIAGALARDMQTGEFAKGTGKPSEEDVQTGDAIAFGRMTKDQQAEFEALGLVAGGKFTEKGKQLSREMKRDPRKALGKLKGLRKGGKGPKVPLAKKKGGKGKGKGDAEKQANREKVAGRLEGKGVKPEHLDALDALKAGDEVDDATAQEMVKLGLAESGEDGLTTTAKGRSLLTASNSGDVDAAVRAMQKAAAPKGGRKAAAKKPAAKGKGKKAAEGKAPTTNAKLQRAGASEQVAGALQDLATAPDRGEAVAELPSEVRGALLDLGLLDDAEGDVSVSDEGRRLMRLIKSGDWDGVKDILQASESADFFHLMDEGFALRLKRGGPKWERATNSYEMELRGEYAAWANAAAADLAGTEDSATFEAKLRDRIDDLIIILVLLGRRRLPEAQALGLGDAVGTPHGMAELAEAVASNDAYLRDSLAADILSKVGGADAMVRGDKDSLAGVFNTFLGRVGSYAGAYWSLVHLGLADKAKQTQASRLAVLRRERPDALDLDLIDEAKVPVRWFLEPMAKHCATCLAYGDRTYDSWDDMLLQTGGVYPSNGTDCDGNCRCSVSALAGDTYQREWKMTWTHLAQPGGGLPPLIGPRFT